MIILISAEVVQDYKLGGSKSYLKNIIYLHSSGDGLIKLVYCSCR